MPYLYHFLDDLVINVRYDDNSRISFDPQGSQACLEQEIRSRNSPHH